MHASVSQTSHAGTDNYQSFTRGLGEAGTIGAPAAILNAAIDALSPLGITDLQMPLTSHTLWQAIQRSKEKPAQ